MRTRRFNSINCSGISLVKRRMKYLLVLIALTMCTSAGSAAGDPQIPLVSGQYVFQHRFGEHPTIPSIPLNVTVRDSHIVVVNPNASEPFPAGVLAEGELMWHAASKQWLIGREASDKSAQDVGGCSEGPEVIDLASKIYWTC